MLQTKINWEFNDGILLEESHSRVQSESALYRAI